MTDYNGWTNYETWNIALWIQNDEYLHFLVEELDNYEQFKKLMTSGHNLRTGDGVLWDDQGVNVKEINELFKR